jgi:hypothetical protein
LACQQRVSTLLHRCALNMKCTLKWAAIPSLGQVFAPGGSVTRCMSEPGYQQACPETKAKLWLSAPPDAILQQHLAAHHDKENDPLEHLGNPGRLNFVAADE